MNDYTRITSTISQFIEILFIIFFLRQRCGRGRASVEIIRTLLGKPAKRRRGRDQALDCTAKKLHRVLLLRAIKISKRFEIFLRERNKPDLTSKMSWNCMSSVEVQREYR